MLRRTEEDLEKAGEKGKRKRSRVLKSYEISENVIDLDLYVDHYTKEFLSDENDFIFIPDPDWLNDNDDR